MPRPPKPQQATRAPAGRGETPGTRFRLTRSDLDALAVLAARWGLPGQPLTRTAALREAIRRCL